MSTDWYIDGSSSWHGSDWDRSDVLINHMSDPIGCFSLHPFHKSLLRIGLCIEPILGGSVSSQIRERTDTDSKDYIFFTCTNCK